MSDVTRVAAVGAGYFSQFHLDGWRALDRVEVVAICDQNAEAARAMADRFGIPAVYTDAATMLDEAAPDLFDIITPPPSHAALIEEAARRRLPAICQKPLAPSYAEALALVETMEAANTTLVVHENFRFSPWYREARRLIGSGELGRLHGISFRLRPGDGQGPRAYLERQAYFQSMGRFLVHETAVHFIDTFRYLMGEVRAVTARLRRLNPAIAGEDAGVILFEFDDARTGLFDGNRLNEHPATDQRRTMGECWIEAEAGVLRLSGDARWYFKPHGADEREHQYDRGLDTFAGGACRNLQAHVLAHLRSGQSVENSGRDYLQNMRLVDAIYDSANRGITVVV